MAEFSRLEKMLDKTKLKYEDIEELVVETRKALAEADYICIRAKKNKEKALENYTRALDLRTKYIERGLA